MRDVVLGRIPLIFGGTTLYATSALLGAATMVVLDAVGAPAAGLVAGTAVGAAVTLLARWRGWDLRGAYACRGPARRRPRSRGRPTGTRRVASPPSRS